MCWRSLTRPETARGRPCKSTPLRPWKTLTITGRWASVSGWLSWRSVEPQGGGVARAFDHNPVGASQTRRRQSERGELVGSPLSGTRGHHLPQPVYCRRAQEARSPHVSRGLRFLVGWAVLVQTGGEDRVFRKRRYVICLITSRGLEMPPAQNAFQTLST